MVPECRREGNHASEKTAKRDFILRGYSKLDRKWVKITLTDPFVYLLGIAFFTSSVAINGFGVFLPTIIDGLG
jgi:hypothetical protein